MSAQLTTDAQQSTALTAATAMEQLEQTGHIDLSQFKNPKTRLDILDQIFPPAEYNRIGFEEFLMMPVPDGVKFYPYMLRFTEEDMWDNENTKAVKKNSDGTEVKTGGMKIKPGHVEPSAEAMEKLGDALNVECNLVDQKEVILNGIKHLQVTYKGSYRRPDGNVITKPGSKALPMLTNSDDLQAHIVENCHKKARRNCIKNVLNMKTTMPREQFLNKTWLIMVPIFEESSPQAQTIEQRADRAKQMMYPQQPVVDVQPEQSQQAEEPDGEVIVEQMIEQIKAATTKAELDQISEYIKGMNLSEEDRKTAGAAWLEHAKFLKEVAAKEQAEAGF